MSKITKLIAIVAASAGVAGVMVTTATPVNASASTKFRYYKNIKDRTYKVTNKKAVIYSNGKIKHKTGAKLGEYGKYVTGYYSSHVTVNGHKRVYYKFKTGSKHTGWVWSGYLKKTSNKSSKTITPKNPVNGSGNWGESDYERLSKGKNFKMNLSDYRRGFLDTVNAERAQRGLSALSLDSKLNDIAIHRATTIITHGGHLDADGNPIFVKEAKAAGITYSRAEILGMESVNAINHGLNSDEDVDNNAKINIVVNTPYNAGKAMVMDYIYDDGDSNNGHRDILFDASYNVIGIGGIWVKDGDSVSNAGILGTK